MTKKKVSPNKYKGLVNKAINFQNTGQFEEAKATYEKLIQKMPHDSQVLYLLGSLYGQMGDFGKCINLLQKSITINNNQINAYQNLAIAYERTAQFDNAIQTYIKALELMPASPDLHCNLGDLYRTQKSYNKALFHINKSLNISPNFENALINKANILAETKEYDLAHSIYHQATNLYPNNPVLLSNYSAFLQVLEKFEEAEKIANQAVQLAPNYPQALSNLGNTLIKQEKFSEAEKNLQHALSLDPNYVEAHINIGFLYHQISLFDKALLHFDEAIRLAPLSSTAHWYRTFTLLIIGKFKDAWDDYEYRFQAEEHVHSPYKFPRYNEELSPDKQLLVNAEQGIGDQVMFSSCLDDLSKQTKNIILECDKRLAPLFKRSFPDFSIISSGEYNNESIREAFPQLEEQISIGSLPRLFRKKIDLFPQTSPYLIKNNDSYSKWKERYKVLGDKLIVGISWQAGTIVEHKKRSMTLESWKDILSCDCHFINLQYGDHKKELKSINDKFGIPIHDWDDSDSLVNIDDFSSQISAVDLIISVGNTNVHLAGSLNTPAWCLVPKVPSWRWLFDGNGCLWYPSVKMYRQTTAHQWNPVLEKIKVDLEKLILQKKNNA